VISQGKRSYSNWVVKNDLFKETPEC